MYKVVQDVRVDQVGWGWGTTNGIQCSLCLPRSRNTFLILLSKVGKLKKKMVQSLNRGKIAERVREIDREREREGVRK